MEVHELANAQREAKGGRAVDGSQVAAPLGALQRRAAAESGQRSVLERILELSSQPDWAVLERHVARHPHFRDRHFSDIGPDGTLEKYRRAEVATAVVQYRHFLALKIQQEDWKSAHLSPAAKQLDLVWHIHLSRSEAYQTDCMLLTGGHVIEHCPILETRERYEHCCAAHCKRMAELNEDVNDDYWPHPSHAFGQFMSCC